MNNGCDKFKSVKPRRVSEQIAEQIRSLILEGELKPGEKLPSERDLSKKIGVADCPFEKGFVFWRQEGY